MLYYKSSGVKDMKKTFQKLIAIGGIFVFLYVVFILNFGNTNNVQRTIKSTGIYSEKEINEAMDVVVNHFKFGFKDCTLIDLVYEGNSSPGWAEEFGADQAIILTSSFYVGSRAEGSFKPNTTYVDWQWILCRIGNGKWKLKTAGYG